MGSDVEILLPGYNGFLPTNTRNPYCARVESGATARTNDKSHITDQPLGWGAERTQVDSECSRGFFLMW